MTVLIPSNLSRQPSLHQLIQVSWCVDVWLSVSRCQASNGPMTCLGCTPPVTARTGSRLPTNLSCTSDQENGWILLFWVNSYSRPHVILPTTDNVTQQGEQYMQFGYVFSRQAVITCGTPVRDDDDDAQQTLCGR